MSANDKPLIFTMARLDHIKNIAGLVDWYGPADMTDLWRYYDTQLRPVGSPPAPPRRSGDTLSLT